MLKESAEIDLVSVGQGSQKSFSHRANPVSHAGKRPKTFPTVQDRGPIWLDDRGTGQWKWLEEVPCRTSLVPLAFPCFVLRLIGLETKNVLHYQGRAGDHFHCTVERSPGHIRCRQERVLELSMRRPKTTFRTLLKHFGSGTCARPAESQGYNKIFLRWERVPYILKLYSNAALPWLPSVAHSQLRMLEKFFRH